MLQELLTERHGENVQHDKRGLTVALVAAALVVACSRPATGPPGDTVGPTSAETSTRAPTSIEPSLPASPSSPTSTEAATPAPAWLGTRPLEPGPTGFPPPQPTPPELFPRSIRTRDVLPPPDDHTFRFTVDEVSDVIAARTTWHESCPVTLGDLRYVTVSFFGFDERLHTGELVVNDDAVEAVVGIFRSMHESRIPLEQVAIISLADLHAPPTGDGNITTAFVCRDTVGATSWSEHAYGRALDINPFQNPYVRETGQGQIVLPELATAYTDRSRHLPGMLHEGDAVVTAIESAGWTWGGDFRTLNDPMHASAAGR